MVLTRHGIFNTFILMKCTYAVKNKYKSFTVLVISYLKKPQHIIITKISASQMLLLKCQFLFNFYKIKYDILTT